MNIPALEKRLEATIPNFFAHAQKLMEELEASGLGEQALIPILRFFERHPLVEFGEPGPLVHFLERNRTQVYASAVMESIARMPAFQTITMAGRLLNGAQNPDEYAEIFSAMQSVQSNKLVADDLKRYAGDLLEVTNDADEGNDRKVNASGGRN